MPVGDTEAYHHDEAKEDEPKFPHIYGPVSFLHPYAGKSAWMWTDRV
jgi:hypothetical protein